jgi:hypothetical protein
MNRTVKITLLFFGILLVGIGLLRLLTPDQKYRLISISPTSLDDISLFDPILLEFDKPISDAFFQSCAFQLSPKIELRTNFSERKISLEPSPRFDPDKDYSLSVLCRDLSKI